MVLTGESGGRPDGVAECEKDRDTKDKTYNDNPSEVTTHSGDKTRSNKVADGKDRSIVTGCKSNSLGLSANAPLFPDTTMVLTGESGGRPDEVTE